MAKLMITLMTMTMMMRTKMSKQCQKCEKTFEAKDELDNFCSNECKQEALAELDFNSDECLSCQ